MLSQWLSSDMAWEYSWKCILTILVLWVIVDALKPRKQIMFLGGLYGIGGFFGFAMFAWAIAIILFVGLPMLVAILTGRIKDD